MIYPFLRAGRGKRAKRSRGHRAPRSLLFFPHVELLEARHVLSGVHYTAVAAGDATNDRAILWTRAVDPEQPQALDLLAEISMDPAFAMIDGFYEGRTDPDRDYTVKIGERTWNLERLWNLKAGLSAADDTLPERLLKEPHRSGPAKGVVVHLDQMLPVYYRARGWNEQGVPTAEKLLELGLASV